jgi:ABC-type Fe3+/spermidine/putrescine transport system ATPase subunit
MAAVRIERLGVSFGGTPVLDIAALEIHDGEFFSLLGPSGCGKTTTLRAIAGLVSPERGRIFIAGRDVTAMPTYQRNLGMVFQKYALFPHLTVAENIGYGLRERGTAAPDLHARIVEALALVALPGYDDRYPHQLSGGQQQRVALARAAVYRPDVLLLDEPLSNLDVKLRVQMRAELKRLQRTLGFTTIFVTHDQQEALALSDRIAVMRGGRIDQVGAPRDLYDSPASAHVAGFVGGTNLIHGVVYSRQQATMTVAVEGAGRVAVPAMAAAIGAAVTIAVKPERILLRRDPSLPLQGRLVASAFLGASYSYLVMLGAQQIEVVSTALVQEGAVGVGFDPGAAQVFE